MATSKEILFSIDDRKAVLRLPVTDATKVDDVRDALKIKCAPMLDEFAAAQIDLYATEDGKVKDGQKLLDVFAPVTVIGAKDIVVVWHPLPKAAQQGKRSLDKVDTQSMIEHFLKSPRAREHLFCALKKAKTEAEVVQAAVWDPLKMLTKLQI